MSHGHSSGGAERRRLGRRCRMEEAAKRFVRRILAVHLVLLGVVMALVFFAALEVYQRTRDEAMHQAEARQKLLAGQTSEGIESYYQSIVDDLDLLRRAETADQAAALKSQGPDEAMRFGQLLWTQLEGRASHLLVVLDRHRISEGDNPPDGTYVTIAEAGGNWPASANIVAQTRQWLAGIEKVTISPAIQFPGGGVNLVCVPLGRQHQRLLVAVVPVRLIANRFLDRLNRDGKLKSLLLDDTRCVMAASDASLVGAGSIVLDEATLHDMNCTYIGKGYAGTRVVEKPFKVGSVTFPGSVITAQPVAVPGHTELGKKWTLLIATPVREVSAVVGTMFRRAALWLVFVAVSVVGILTSTAVQLIRGRLRLEAARQEAFDLLTREVEQAREIQLAWLPNRNNDKACALDIAAINQPASHVSGDFYNWFELPDGRLVVIIGDVTGHGMAAAFLMATTQLLVKTTMLRLQDPGACLDEVNEQLATQMSGGGQFVTMLILVLDTDRGEIEIGNAGHFPPLMGDGESFQPLDIAPQLVLGVEPDIRYKTQRFDLPAKASLLLYTDGVLDVQDVSGERFQPERLRRSLYGRFDSAQTLIDTVLSAVNEFRGTRDLPDDLTLVAINTACAPAQKEEVGAVA